MKDITQSLLDLSVRRYPASLLPLEYDGVFVQQWIESLWDACAGPYFLKRSKPLEAISAKLQPYSETAEDAPGIDMGRVQLLECFENKFKSEDDILEVLTEIVKRLAAYLRDHHMLLTGDFYCFWNVWKFVREHPADFWKIVPLPGPFHMGLNAQEVIFLSFRPVLAQIWDAVFPTRAFPLRPSPLQRKYLLEILCRAWKKSRTSCVNLLKNLDSLPLEAAILMPLFDDFIPVSLDLYASFLGSDFAEYDANLLRALKMFMQLGKNHYVLLIAMFQSMLQHWKKEHAELYQSFTSSIRFYSEEEIEVFHSMIRPHIHGQRTAKQVVRTVNYCGATAEMMAEWIGKRRQKKLAVPQKKADFSALSVTKAVRALKAMFRAVAVIEKPCSPSKKPREWDSTVLGSFNDHLLPFAMQQARVRIRGCRGTWTEHRVELQLFLDRKFCRLCGHASGPGPCGDCKCQTIAVTVEMLRNATSRGSSSTADDTE